MKTTLNNSIRFTLAIPLAVIVMAGVMAASLTTKAKADPGRPIPGAVVFSCTQFFENGYPSGYKVYIVSQGQHAPKILPGDDMAQTFENLLANGCEITQLGGLQFLAIRR